MKIISGHRDINRQAHENCHNSLFIWVKSVFVFVLIFMTYKDVIISLIHAWSDQPSYSHGFLIPLISLYIVYTRRRELERLNIQPEIIKGLLLIMTAVFFLIAGEIGSVAILQRISLILILPGIVLMLYGRGHLKQLLFPIAYLIFMIPVADLILDRLHWPAQILSAKIATVILNIFNIPVVRDVQYMYFPSVSIEVARECSGLKYLISMIALSIPLSYFTQNILWRKIFLVIVAMLLVIPINGIRIALIGIWAYNGGSVLHGPNHVLQGLFVAQAGFILLLFVSYILNRIPGNSEIK